MSTSLRDDLTTVDQKIDILDIAGKLNINTAAAKEFVRYALANALLMERKQLDYGPNNLSKFGAYGCLVRMSDKFERMLNLYNNRRGKAKNESIADSWRDFGNYGIIGQMCEDKVWPDKETKVETKPAKPVRVKNPTPISLGTGSVQGMTDNCERDE
jgi:hypothetical protein